MSAALTVNYSILKDRLLKIWIPAIGTRTPFEFLEKNCRKFCQFAFDGYTEISLVILDLVKTQLYELSRQLFFDASYVNCFDTQPPFQLGETILTGSFSDGLFLFLNEPPDVDFMCVLGNIIFSEKDQNNGCLFLREDTPFVDAYLLEKEAKQAWKEFLHDGCKGNEQQQISSKKLKEKFEENYQKSNPRLFQCLLQEKVDGAAVTVNKPEHCTFTDNCVFNNIVKSFFQPFDTLNFEALDKLCSQSCLCVHYIDPLRIVSSSDIVLCIYCEGWPSCAKEWITRERFWPDLESVNVISHGGFHIVPKSSVDGDFRLSFTSAETMLIKTLTPLQYKVMKAFKAIVKYHQEFCHSIAKDVISSYHLKTIAFWYFEKISKEMWTEETVVHHLVTLIEELAEVLRIQNLPMYFMPKVNLLEYNDPDVTLDLTEKILQLSQNFSTMSKALESFDVFRTTKELLYKTNELFRREKEKLDEKLKKEPGKCSKCLFTFIQTMSASSYKKDGLYQSPEKVGKQPCDFPNH